MRPRSLEEYVGQDPILGPGRLLRRAIQADQLSSLIFYGPPGSGKTTLARVIANSTKGRFITLNAVLTGIADIRAAIEEARKEKEFYDRRSILFVDEVHRWNKAQQDALLPWVENGTFILIGATTENPYFEVNRALVSRSRIFRLECLSRQELFLVARHALEDRERGYGKWKIDFEEGALEHLVEMASGDARSLLNALELAVETSLPDWPPEEGAQIRIAKREAEESIQRKAILYDKDGDYHFDVISAFIKSLRGSDPDAGLYWLARMVAAGEDPAFIFRRMLILACEDVGLADPGAIGVVESCAAAFERIGFPEGNFHLAHAALYLANCPKSNSVMGFFDALEAVKAEQTEVPDHLKDPSRDAEGLGHGKGYSYPHAFREHWTAQAYLPRALLGRVFYQPSEIGWEAQAAKDLVLRRELSLSAALEGQSGGKGEGGRAAPELEWLKRLSERNGAQAAKDRDAIFAGLEIAPHSRILVLGAGEGLVIWEALRRAPEGQVLGLCWEAEQASLLADYGQKLSALHRPLINACQWQNLEAQAGALGSLCGYPVEKAFEACLGRNALPPHPAREGFLSALWAYLEPGAKLSLSEILAGAGSRLSDILIACGAEPEPAFLAAEEDFYRGLKGSSESYAQALEIAGFGEIEIGIEERTEARFISGREIDQWFASSSSFGKFMQERLGKDAATALAARLRECATGLGELAWKRNRALIRATSLPRP